MLGIILCNVFVLAVFGEVRSAEGRNVVLIIDNVLLMCYVGEVLMRLLASNLVKFFTDKWNVYVNDRGIVCMCMCATDCVDVMLCVFRWPVLWMIVRH